MWYLLGILVSFIIFVLFYYFDDDNGFKENPREILGSLLIISLVWPVSWFVFIMVWLVELLIKIK